MRYIGPAVSIMLVMFLAIGCGDDDEEEELPTTGTISGTVIDADGTPLGNILVDTAPWGGFRQCTNSDGTFTLEGLPLDTDLYVYAGGSDHWCDGGPTNYRKEYWSEVGDLDSATAIMLIAGNEDATGIVFTLEIDG